MDSVTLGAAPIEEVTGERAAVAVAPIVVAVDFSPDSEAALLWACDYAKRIGATVEVLHVVHDPAEAPGKYKPGEDDPLEPMGEVAERKLAKFLASVSARHAGTNVLQTARTICRSGLPSRTIVDLAQSHRARHLVLGSRGRNGIVRALLGSTSEQVVRHAPLPVTIVKAKSE